MEKKVTIEANNLIVAYGDRTALTIDNLNVAGDVIAIVGQNGSGKSTLIKTILDLLIPRKGGLSLYSADKTKLIPEKHMAFSPENGAVFSDLKVESYLKLWCRIKCPSANYYLKEGKYYLERLGIIPLLGRFGRELSKGERRRVQTVVGFLFQPRLFLFDEPFDGLDIVQSNQLMEIMQEENVRTSILVSTHRMEIVERIADTIILLNKGKLVIADTVDNVCKKLAGETLRINNLETRSYELTKSLRNHFPESSVTGLGGSLAVTGKNLDQNKLKEFLSKSGFSNFNIQRQEPTLVDAMNYFFEHQK